MILQVIIAIVAGWINRHQQHVITHLKEEKRVLTSKLPNQLVKILPLNPGESGNFTQFFANPLKHPPSMLTPYRGR
jgi:hypothetical protein